MVRIKCNTLGLLETNRSKTPEGHEYIFSKGAPTEVDNKDATYFLSLKDSNGPYFEKVDFVSKIKDMFEEFLAGDRKLTHQEIANLPRDKKAELIEQLTGLKPTIRELERGLNEMLYNIQEVEYEKMDKKKKVSKKDIKKKEPEEPVKVKDPVKEDFIKADYAELKGLNKDDQVVLIRHIGGDEVGDIPKYEAQRIDLLLKLQDDGNDILKILDELNEVKE